MLDSQRHLFDIPAGIAYFNTAYNSPLLNASRDRLVAAAGAKSRPWERTPDDFFADAETCRRLAAFVLGGDVDGYAVVPAASYGISTAARAIEPTLQPGDRILVMDEEFPSNVLPWRRIASATGAQLITVATPEDQDWTSAVLKEMANDPRVVALSACHWTNGARLDLEPIGAMCRESGAILVLDVTQSLGAMPFNVDAVEPDFMVAAGYKWLLCPYGFGLMYVSPAWRDARPLEESWLARTGASDFASLVRYSDTYVAGARRFDVGETCVTTILPGAIAALEQLKAWGVENIARSLAAISQQIADRIEPLGLSLPPADQRCPHMFGAKLPDGFSGDLVTGLRRQGVYVSQRGSAIRFSPHLHVTGSDIDQLVDALAAELKTRSAA